MHDVDDDFAFIMMHAFKKKLDIWNKKSSVKIKKNGK